MPIGIGGMMPMLFGGGMTGGVTAAAGAGGGLGMLSNPWLSGGMMVVQGIMAARQQQAQAMAAKIQFEEQQHQAKWQNQIRNRNIAKANALQWMNNTKIAEAANKERAESEFYLRYNYNNETGELSRQVKQANDQLTDNLFQRGVDPSSGTGRALFRMALEKQTDAFKAGRINYANQMVSAERTQDERLGQRNFNYNSHVPFMGGGWQGADAGSVFASGAASGILGGVLGGIAQAGQNSLNQQILAT
jgi:hypothetical protein